MSTDIINFIISKKLAEKEGVSESGANQIGLTSIFVGMGNIQANMRSLLFAKKMTDEVQAKEKLEVQKTSLEEKVIGLEQKVTDYISASKILETLDASISNATDKQKIIEASKLILTVDQLQTLKGRASTIKMQDFIQQCIDSAPTP